MVGNTITIGRTPDNDIVIPDPRVSRHHGRLTLVGSSFVYENFGSNGTYLYGRPVDTVTVTYGTPMLLAGYVPMPWDAVRRLMPTMAAGIHCQQPAPQYYRPVASESQHAAGYERMRHNDRSIAPCVIGMILSIIGFMLSFAIIGILFAIPGLIVSWVGIGCNRGKGMSIAGIILGFIAIGIAISIVSIDA